jgi:hypothetical protein
MADQPWVVLAAYSGESGFTPLPDVVQADSPDNAIRKVIIAGNITAGTFAAIPENRWQPRRVIQKTRVTMRLESDPE